jgi:hypothetical protein
LLLSRIVFLPQPTVKVVKRNDAEITSEGSSKEGEGGEIPDSGRRDDKLPPPITSMAPAIFRAGGGPAFLTATEPAYLEFSLTTAIGMGAGAIEIC